jgi:DNA-binding transcriptional LysR family regulator
MLMEHEIDVRLLRAFVSVADQGGFSAAAAALHITQPALSRRIRDLEDLFGVRLFDRTTRRVRLTSSGEMLLPRSRDLLASAHALYEGAQALHSGHSGVLRLGGTPFAMESVVAPFLARYRKRHPEIDVQLYEHGAARVLEAVVRGDVHLAVASEGEPPLASRPLFPWRVLAVVARTHALARRKVVEIEALSDQPILTLSRDFITRRTFDAGCESSRLHPSIRMESVTPGALVAMARAGYGVAIVPSALVFSKQGVKALPIVSRGRSLGRSMAIQWDSQRFQPTYAKLLADELEEFARGTYPGQEYEFAPPLAEPSSPSAGPGASRRRADARLAGLVR